MRMRKLFAGVVAAATMLGGLALGASTANAAEGQTTFTFTASSEAQLTGRDIAVYKIGDYVQHGDVYGVETASTVTDKTVIKDALGTAGDNLSEDYLASALSQGLLDQSSTRPWDTPDATRTFAENLAKSENLAKLTAVTDAKLGTPTAITGGTGDAQWQATMDLDPGIYLIVDNTKATNAEVTKAVPMIVYSGTLTDGVITNAATAGAGATVNFKNTLNTEKSKSVNVEGSVYVCQELTYTLKGEVADPAPVSFVFTDKPGAGLTIDTGSFSAKYGASAEDVNTDVSAADFVKYFQTDFDGLVDGTKGGANASFTVTLTAEGLAALKGKYIAVSYTATVNSDAVSADGKPFSVENKLVKNDGTSTSDTENKTYGFQIVKTAADGTTKLENAGFTIRNSDGKYLVQDAITLAWTTTDKEAEATEFKTDANGSLIVKGLAAGDYTVNEKTVPNGYMQSVKPEFTITIGDASSLKTADSFNLVSYANDVFTVKNVKNITQLPLTGAAGTALFTVIGLLLAGAAATVALKSRETKRALRA
ncbi:SpaA isopeptide-forming pilin-related protein [Bifidobacterium scardovii]|uniref:SpaA isopeptide-forming pilin-related protein n=1 Tax=Bifidobacterium scardovii TaxID=158787 RepID=UPI002915F1CE|nr:SpaA isopeptide-forming pilin-related protein [Bifidobacterium scardovii]